MERRRANNAYAKLLNKEQREGCSNGVRRSHSMRASFRLLKGKLNNPALLQSPFRRQPSLNLRQRINKLETLKLLDEMETITVVRSRKSCENVLNLNKKPIDGMNTLSGVPIGSSAVPLKACKLLQIPESYCLKYLTEQEQQRRFVKRSEQVPRNLTKVSEESEPTCSSANSGQAMVKYCETEKKKMTEKCFNHDIYQRITRGANEGIYGTTRMRTATIRKPMPYLNNYNVLTKESETASGKTRIRPSDHRVETFNSTNTLSLFVGEDSEDFDSADGSGDGEVVLRKSVNTYSCNNNNNPNKINNNLSNRINRENNHAFGKTENYQKRDHLQFPASAGAGAFRWSEQLNKNVSVARIRTAISSNSQDFKEMEFLIPQIPSTASAMSGTRISSSSSSVRNSIDEIERSTLSVSRQFRLNVHNHQQQSLAKSRIMSYPKNIIGAKSMANVVDEENICIEEKYIGDAAEDNAEIIVRNCPDENNAGNAQNLVVHRQSTSASRFKAGNTPHRNKMSKKQFKLAQAQLDKLTQINAHLHALFSAVEHGHLDKARTILESTDVDANSINSDGLTALDVAVLSNNRSMTKMLLQHGARECSQYSVSESIGTKLNGLLKDAESRIHDLSGLEAGAVPLQPTFASRPSISSIIIGNTGSSVTGCTGNEIDKQIGIWERRVKGLRRMLLGWDQARPPDAPTSLTVDVTGETSIALQIFEPLEGAIATKFKVQWSTRADFSNVVGERDIMEWTSFHGTMGAQCQVTGLTQGRRYFLRAACGNVKGWGPYKTSIPGSITSSSWRDLYCQEDRFYGRQRVLDNLFAAVRVSRPSDVSELTLDTNSAQRRNPKKKTTIKQLFSVASKFQKNLRRGIYLASIVYCEDKVLVTSEDFLPVIEIDETYPSSLNSDYHWLMKVACTWEDVKSLRTDMERNLTSAVHFRTKLLSAVCQMQSALGLTDLGQLYYKPLRDSHGTIVLTSIQCVKSQKAVSILNSRWLPINKLQKKIVALHEDYNINEIVISSIGEQMHYHQTSMQRLGGGLYLGYLKMQCSVDQIQVVVPVRTPNVLPHCKVRDNSHINAEEWQILKRGIVDKTERSVVGGGSTSLQLSLEFNANSDDTSEVQRLFLYDLTTAAHKLFAYMNIKPEDAVTHRLYDVEVIEHSKDISFLVICPSVELTCAAPGQSEILLQRDDLASLSIQAFEMIHLRTYQSGIIQKYARLSCILELDTALANHSHREAFSTSELQTAKERLCKLNELTASLNAVWKTVRWLMDVIAFARDKNVQPSIAMQDILDFAHITNEMDDGKTGTTKQQLLQLPIRDVKFTKSGSGRGSWPGPSGTSHADNSACLEAEHSKSEQNLGRTAITPTSASSLLPSQQMPTRSKGTQNLLQVGGGNDSQNSSDSIRKSSGDSVTSQYTSRGLYSTAESTAGSNNELCTIFAIPPSRSADTLALGTLDSARFKQPITTHRKRTNSSNTMNATTPTPLIKVHSSSSAPYLARDVTSGSNLSLKTTEPDNVKPTSSLSTTHGNVPSFSGSSGISGISKMKASSSTNLREGGLYLKTTLSALQTQIKPTISDELPQTSKASKSVTSTSEEDDGGYTTSSSGIIQVYTAYNTGLASGTSLKLHVTPKTSAREVINLVVKQLNMAAVLKGNNGPIYTADMLDNFCLVAVIGARERCLRDDFKPLQLQNPWKKGRLYVRQKHELLAAIEHSTRKSQLI